MATSVNAVGPKSPVSASAWIRHDTAMQTAPAQTQNRDSTTVGQRDRNHNADMPQQQTATATANISLTRPCGPVGLQINVIEMALIPISPSATRRQVVCCKPRAARNAVSQ